MPFDYFYGREDAEQYLFYRIPKALITGEQFRDISCESKLLYGLMLDRLSLSMKNGWFDDLNRAYIVYTVEDIMSDLQCGNQKAGKLLQELEQKAGLIKRKRQGLGKPSLIYVLKFSTGYPPKSSESHFKKCENHTSGDVKTASLEMCESHTNKTEFNKTEMNKNNPIYPSQCIYPGEGPHPETDRIDGYDGISHDPMKSDPMEKRRQYEQYFRDQLEIDCFKDDPYYKFDQGRVNEIMETCVDIMCSTAPTIRVNGEDMPSEVVKSRIMKLGYSHVQYILDCFHDQISDIRNIRAYLLTTLYNAPLTIDHYYDAKVHYDMSHPKE